MTSSWFSLSTLNYDARSTTHQIYFSRLRVLQDTKPRTVQYGRRFADSGVHCRKQKLHTNIFVSFVGNSECCGSFETSVYLYKLFFIQYSVWCFAWRQMHNLCSLYAITTLKCVGFMQGSGYVYRTTRLKSPELLLLYLFVVDEKREICDLTAGYGLLICVIICVVSV